MKLVLQRASLLVGAAVVISQGEMMPAGGAGELPVTVTAH
jgi:hypothetical protein